MNFSEYVTVLSGNTDLLEKAKLDKRIMLLESERKNFQSDKATATMKLNQLIESVDKHERVLARAQGDLEHFNAQAKHNEDGTTQKLIRLDGVYSKGIKVLAAKLHEYASKACTKGEYMCIGEIYGFTIFVKSETPISDGFDFTDNKIFVNGKGGIYYSHNSGHLAQDILSSLGSIHSTPSNAYSMSSPHINEP